MIGNFQVSMNFNQSFFFLKSIGSVVTTLHTPISVDGHYQGHINFLGKVEITRVQDPTSSLKSS